MKKGFYLLGYPTFAASLVLLVFIIIDPQNDASPAETVVLSETAEAPESADDVEEQTDVPLGEFENMHEFQVYSNESEAEETPSKPQFQEPVHLSIPSIEVEGPVENVGILDNGEMGVPDAAEKIGWFEPGVKPGERGNAVMAGHVDSRSGPSVFYDLKETEAGDEVQVTDENGRELTFEVTSVVQYDRREAPIQEIFGSTDKRRLNLITCTGTFNQEYGTHDDRLVVYTELVEEEPETEENPPEPPGNIEISGPVLRWYAVDDEDVVGYRVYEEAADGSSEQTASIASYERKAYTSDTVGERPHFVTSVNRNGEESEPSERK
jgi:sortase A